MSRTQNGPPCSAFASWWTIPRCWKEFVVRAPSELARDGVRESRELGRRAELGVIHRDGAGANSKMRWHGMDAERGAFLGMSLLLGVSRLRSALIGPLLNAPWAGKSQPRLRLGIWFGYLCMCATGYARLGAASHLWVACLCIVLAHIGGIDGVGFLNHVVAAEH